MILTQEYSCVASTSSLDSRAWLISPQGEIHPCGDNHEEYVHAHPEEFEGEAPGLVSAYALVQAGWIKVGVINYSLYIESPNRLTESMLSLLQDFAKEMEAPFKRVEVHIVGVNLSSFTRDEFFTITPKDVNRRGVSQYASRLGSRFDQVVLEAWMVESDGTVHHCGKSHDAYMWKHPEEFGGITSSLELVKNHGWTRVGVRLGRFFVECHVMTPRLLDVFQKLAREAKVHFDRVEIHVSHNNPVSRYFEPDEFQTISIKDINRKGVSEYASQRKWAALPHSRNHLKNISLEELSYPLRKAFLALNLENKYQKMSLNEISSQLRRHETLLEDETGWTADELIRDLNQLLE